MLLQTSGIWFQSCREDETSGWFVHFCGNIKRGQRLLQWSAAWFVKPFVSILEGSKIWGSADNSSQNVLSLNQVLWCKHPISSRWPCVLFCWGPYLSPDKTSVWLGQKKIASGLPEVIGVRPSFSNHLKWALLFIEEKKIITHFQNLLTSKETQ